MSSWEPFALHRQQAVGEELGLLMCEVAALRANPHAAASRLYFNVVAFLCSTERPRLWFTALTFHG